LLTSKLGVLSRSTGYGMTETAAVGTTMTGRIFDLNPRSAGIKSPIIDMRIAETDTEHPHFAGDGEIQMRGITVTPGYWTPSATTEAFTRDGWLRTGDLGHFDAEGFLHVTGRIKEIIIRGGENISPIEIEDAAYRHPAVKEVVVVGVPDDRMGEELAMVCHLHTANSLTAEELRADLATNLPAFKVPRDIILSQEPLPRNASEKLHRLAVRRMLTGA
jgi:long-chain acyl-CoA synthetase